MLVNVFIFILLVIIVCLTIRLKNVSNHREFKSIVFKKFKGNIPNLLLTKVKSISIAHSNIPPSVLFSTFTDGFYSHWSLTLHTIDDQIIMLTTRATESVTIHYINPKTIHHIKNNRFIVFKDVDNWEYLINTGSIVNIESKQLTINDITIECYNIVSKVSYLTGKFDCQYVIGSVYNKLTPKSKHVTIIKDRFAKALNIAREILTNNRFTYIPVIPSK